MYIHDILQASYHVWLPQRFTHAVHLLCTGATHNKVLCHHGAANQIQGADEGFKGFGVQPSNDRLDVVWPKPEQVRHDPGTQVSIEVKGYGDFVLLES